jgi:hypothetical protein
MVVHDEHRALVSVYEFFVYRRHPDYRLVTLVKAPFPEGARKDDWQSTRTRQADDVNEDIRRAVARSGYALFRIGLSLSDLPPP